MAATGARLDFHWCREDEGVWVGRHWACWAAHDEKAAGLVLGQAEKKK
jgi:hypothetical protein